MADDKDVDAGAAGAAAAGAAGVVKLNGLGKAPKVPVVVVEDAAEVWGADTAGAAGAKSDGAAGWPKPLEVCPFAGGNPKGLAAAGVAVGVAVVGDTFAGEWAEAAASSGNQADGGDEHSKGERKLHIWIIS